MPVKVFLSWSGSQSKAIAELVRNWLPGVLQFVKPYFTPDDIEKGARWDSDISKELESSNIGMIFLTKENLESSWILFEAGALSKKLEKSKTCTVLLNVEPTDIKGPLVSFQHTKIIKADFKKLLITINKEGEASALDPQVLDSVFEMWWPKLESEINKALEDEKPKSKKGGRSDREILEEVLELTRLSARRERDNDIHPGAISDLVETYSKLKRALNKKDLELVTELCEKLDTPVRYMARRGGPRGLLSRRSFEDLEEIIEKKDMGGFALLFNSAF